MTTKELGTAAESVKTAYESNPDTNPFTDAERDKLAGLPSVLDKDAVGLGNVNNTADADKPVSTAAQAALDAKADKSATINALTDSYTLVIGDAGELVSINKATATNLTVPPEADVAFSVGTEILLAQLGTGQVTIVAGAGVTIRTAETLKLAKQYAAATLIKIGADEWLLTGNLEAA